jgi:benzoylformate decarboxylase
VKWAVEVTRVQDLPRIVRRAAKIALTPPTGPVFISLPGDILDETANLDLGRSVRVDARTQPSDQALDRLAEMLLAAERPIIVAGQELSIHDAFAEAGELADLLGAAVYQQSVGYTAQFLTEHPACMGSFTRHQKQIRSMLEPYDLLICLGADLMRMSVYSAVEPLPENLAVVHLSERSAELGKNFRTDIALQANVKETLKALLPRLRARRTADDAARASARIESLKPRNWSACCAQAKLEAMRAADTSPIDPSYLMLAIAEALPDNAVVVDEAFISSLSLPKLLPLRETKSYYGLTSGGIGFAIPGAVGISLALPGRPVVAVVGDGSTMFGAEGLWTAAHHNLPITYVIANNQSYRIIKERLVSFRSTDKFVGMDLKDPEIDFVHLAKGFGLPAQRVTNPRDVPAVLRASFSSGRPNLVEVRVADGFGG